MPEGLEDPKAQSQVQKYDPHQIEGVNNGQTAQVNDGRAGHPTFTETDHVEREEVRWKETQNQEVTS